MNKSDTVKKDDSAPTTMRAAKRLKAQENLIVALERNGAHIQRACAACGISRSTFYEWMKHDEKFRERAMAVIDEKIDNVEFALYSAAIKGNTTAQIFYLKNKRPTEWKDTNRLDATLEIVDVEKTAENIREVIKKYGLHGGA
jgi:hypothetical protein